MYIKQLKKMLIMNILDILKRYTDENHRLSQKEIMDIFLDLAHKENRCVIIVTHSPQAAKAADALYRL